MELRKSSRKIGFASFEDRPLVFYAGNRKLLQYQVDRVNASLILTVSYDSKVNNIFNIYRRPKKNFGPDGMINELLLMKETADLTEITEIIQGKLELYLNE